MVDNRELLLACLREEAAKKKTELLNCYSEKDWEDVVKTATQQKVLPILYYTLKPLHAKLNVPEHIWEKLRKVYYFSAARNMRLYEEILQNISIFDKESLSVILLKGAHLANKVYGNLALRPMSDVDLLVKYSDLEKVHRLLIENGFSTSEHNQGSFIEHMAPYRKSNFMIIEIHHHITRAPFSERVNLIELWDRSYTETIQGIKVRTMCPEDLILHLCVHTTFHHVFNNGLIPYFDIAYSVKHYEKELNWLELWNRGKEWGLDRCVYLMLALTDKLIGLSMPEYIRQEINQDQEIPTAVNTAEEMIFDNVAVGDVSHFIARLFSRQSWRLKVKYLMWRAFPPKETMSIKKQDIENKRHLKIYGLYLRRQLTLLKRHGKDVWLGLRRNPETIAAIEVQNKRNMLRDWLTQKPSSKAYLDLKNLNKSAYWARK